MSKPLIKLALPVLQYVVTLGIAAFLLWFVYKDLDFKDMLSRFSEVNYFWVILSMVLATVSNYIRAYRWNLMLEPLGYDLKVPRTFLAVLTGYFANLLVPRMGEVSKCGVLKKTDNVSMTNSIGSVVAERAIDVLTLLVIVALTFFLEFDKLSGFMLSYFEGDLEGFDKSIAKLILFGGVFVFIAAGFFVLLRIFRDRIKRHPLFIKVRNLIRSLLDGMLSIRKIKHKSLFWLSTVTIWVLYYFMSYVVFFSIAETSHLGFLAGLSVLLMGGIAMATPVQGGIGPYHLLVSGVLILYGVTDADGKFFAFLLHTSQFVLLLVTGGIGFVISMFIPKRNAYVNR